MTIIGRWRLFCHVYNKKVAKLPFPIQLVLYFVQRYYYYPVNLEKWSRKLRYFLYPFFYLFVNYLNFIKFSIQQKIVKKKTAPLPAAIASKIQKEKKVVDPLIQKRPKNFSIGNDFF